MTQYYQYVSHLSDWLQTRTPAADPPPNESKIKKKVCESVKAELLGSKSYCKWSRWPPLPILQLEVSNFRIRHYISIHVDNLDIKSCCRIDNLDITSLSGWDWHSPEFFWRSKQEISWKFIKNILKLIIWWSLVQFRHKTWTSLHKTNNKVNHKQESSIHHSHQKS